MTQPNMSLISSLSSKAQFYHDKICDPERKVIKCDRHEQLLFASLKNIGKGFHIFGKCNWLPHLEVEIDWQSQETSWRSWASMSCGKGLPQNGHGGKAWCLKEWSRMGGAKLVPTSDTSFLCYAWSWSEYPASVYKGGGASITRKVE